jgi:hypothetical protein
LGLFFRIETPIQHLPSKGSLENEDINWHKSNSASDCLETKILAMKLVR